MDDAPLTDSFGKKTYEYFLTKSFDDAFRALKMIGLNPTYENLKMGFAEVQNISSRVLAKKTMAKKIEVINPKLNLINIALNGAADNDKTKQALSKLGVEKSIDFYGHLVFTNSQNILTELYTIMEALQLLAYDEGMFLFKPMERKFGKAGIHDVLEQ